MEVCGLIAYKEQTSEANNNKATTEKVNIVLRTVDWTFGRHVANYRGLRARGDVLLGCR